MDRSSSAKWLSHQFRASSQLVAMVHIATDATVPQFGDRLLIEMLDDQGTAKPRVESLDTLPHTSRKIRNRVD